PWRKTLFQLWSIWATSARWPKKLWHVSGTPQTRALRRSSGRPWQPWQSKNLRLKPLFLLRQCGATLCPMLRGICANLATLLLTAVSLHAGGDPRKMGQSYVRKPDQVADIAEPKLISAKQACENWALAAGLESMLAQLDVSLDQNFWVMRMNAGEICSPDL